MGLDGVELIMAVEEEFGFDIDDAAAEKMRTPRDMIDYVCELLRTAQNGPTGGCASQQAFYRMRRVLMELTGRSRREISPATPIEALFPGRRVYARDWTRIRKALNPGLGQGYLAPPGWLTWPCLTLPAGVFVYALWRGLPGCSFREGFLCVFSTFFGTGLGCAVLFALAFVLVHRNLTRGYVSPGIKTLRDMGPPFLQALSGKTWTRDDVAARVKQIVKDQLGIADEKYREDADFIRDLGIG